MILKYQPATRFKEWKRFRETLTEKKTDLQHLEDVANYWGKCPRVLYYVDWDDPNGWPDPWEIIHDGQFCNSGLALCMYHTLLYSCDSRWNNDRLEIVLIKDPTLGIFLTIWVDKRYILNYESCNVCIIRDVSSNFEIMQKYQFCDGKYLEIFK